MIPITMKIEKNTFLTYLKGIWKGKNESSPKINLYFVGT